MLYIVTSVHNRFEITEKFIQQLKKQTFQDFTLVLVDDGSTDGTDKMVKKELPNSVILYGDGNLWWGGSLHKAYLYLSKVVKDEDCVYICNDDITITDDFIETGINCLKKTPQYLICSKGMSDKTGLLEDGVQIRDSITAEGKRVEDGVPGNYCTTRSLFMTGKAYKKIGGMHPILLPHYRSDIEYTIRAARKGYPCIAYSELTYLVHMDTTGNSKATSLKQRFSKKYYNNPIYNFTFILMVTPVKDLPKYIAHLMKRKTTKADK